METEDKEENEEDGNNENNGGDVNVAVRCPESMYTGIQSFISYVYKQSGVPQVASLINGMSLYCKGSKRQSRKIKQQLTLKLFEGKQPMSREVCTFLAKKLFESENKTSYLHMYSES